MNTAAPLAMVCSVSAAVCYTTSAAAETSAASIPDLSSVAAGNLHRRVWAFRGGFRTPRPPITAVVNLGSRMTAAAARRSLLTLVKGAGGRLQQHLRDRSSRHLIDLGVYESIRGRSGGRRRIVVVPGQIAPRGVGRRRGERYVDDPRTGNASPGVLRWLI